MSLYLIDTSAIARRSHPEVDRVIDTLLRSRSAATCIATDLEMGYSGVSHSDVKTTMSRRATDFQRLPISETIADRAREVQVLMAARGQHRAAGVLDLLTAAIAEHHGAVVLHYDADFEHIAAVTGQAQQWVVPRGTAG